MQGRPLILPIIDITPFLEKEADEKLKREVAHRLHDACVRFGAFYLAGHGIDEAPVISRIREFFDLPEEVKQSISVSGKGIARGYLAMGKESGSEMLEVKEGFSYGYSFPGEMNLSNDMQAHNVWPAADQISSSWRQQMEKLFNDMCEVAEALEKAFSMSYGKEEDYLSSFCRGGESISMMRLFHYLPYSLAEKDFSNNPSERIGSSPHTDWGFLTLILQQPDAEGLQLHHENEWMDVPPVSGSLIVNCGDYFSLLTGGEYISPMHRVVSTGKERLSAVLFYYPDYDARIPSLGKQTYSLFINQQQAGQQDPLPSADPEKMSFGEFIAEKWRQVKR